MSRDLHLQTMDNELGPGFDLDPFCSGFDGVSIYYIYHAVTSVIIIDLRLEPVGRPRKTAWRRGRKTNPPPLSKDETVSGTIT